MVEESSQLHPLIDNPVVILRPRASVTPGPPPYRRLLPCPATPPHITVRLRTTMKKSATTKTWRLKRTG